MEYDTFAEVYHDIDNEGIGYFIQDYTSSGTMPDEESKRLFKEAEDALNRFEAYIKEKYAEEIGRE